MKFHHNKNIFFILFLFTLIISSTLAADFFYSSAVHAGAPRNNDSESVEINGTTASSPAGPSGGAESSSEVQTPNTSSTAAAPPTVPQQAQPAAPASTTDIKKNINRIASMNRDIFMLEKLAETKNQKEDLEKIEKALNSLYTAREALSARLASDCAKDTTNNSMRELRSGIYNLKLYDAAGFDSTLSRILADDNLNTGSTAGISLNPKDSVLELKSFVKLEESRLSNPITYEDDVNKNISSYDDSKLGELTSEASLTGPGDSGELVEKSAPLSPTEIFPESGADDAPIDKPVTIKFDPEKIKKAGQKIEVKVKKADMVQKFAPKNAPGSTGKIDVRWDPAENSLVISHTTPLDRKGVYGVSVDISHELQPQEAAGTSETQLQQTATHSSSGTTETQASQTPAQQGGGASASSGAAITPAAAPKFMRSVSMNGGLIKKVDINYIDNVVDYHFNWNFGTKPYPAPSAPAEGGATQTAETALGSGASGSGEVSVTDKRDTDEGSLRQSGGSTAESTVKKELPLSPGFETPMAIPTIIIRNPEGPAVRRKTDIFVVFSCDIDASSIKPGTMSLSVERGRGLFEPLTGETQITARKLSFLPSEPLVPGKNYRVEVSSVKSASGVLMPVGEVYFFKTAPAVISVKLPYDGSVSLSETFEITLSQNIDDVKMRFNVCDGTRESELEFELFSRLYRQETPAQGISKYALSTGGPSISPFEAKTPQKAPVGSDITGKSQIVSSRDKAPEEIPVSIQFKPRKPLEKGKFYKLDVYSGSEYIDDGIIKFKAQ